MKVNCRHYSCSSSPSVQENPDIPEVILKALQHERKENPKINISALETWRLSYQRIPTLAQNSIAVEKKDIRAGLATGKQGGPWLHGPKTDRSSARFLYRLRRDLSEASPILTWACCVKT